MVFPFSYFEENHYNQLQFEIMILLQTKISESLSNVADLAVF